MEINQKYQIIYADPPWRYEHIKRKCDAIENHYPTMELDDICDLKIPSEDNSVLFLWATAPKLEEAMRVLNSWGYKYRTQLVWDKEIMGMGYWFRGQHEILLIGVKGKVSPPPPTARYRSVFRQKRQKHSQKPSQIREMIENMYPNFKRIELFARQKTKGWDVWGNEVESDIKI